MFTSNGAVETEETGARLAQDLKAGDVLALVGELGAGKTQFVRGIARGLGCSGPVTSPTFTIVHEYAGGILPLYHFDWYRLEDTDELRGIGYDEYVDSNGVCVIEWADKFSSALPARTHWIKFHIASADVRMIEFASCNSTFSSAENQGEL